MKRYERGKCPVRLQELLAGLPIEIRFADYLDINETFDHIVLIGMFEDVGYKNYSQYIKVARRCLKDEEGGGFQFKAGRFYR